MPTSRVLRSASKKDKEVLLALGERSAITPGASKKSTSVVTGASSASAASLSSLMKKTSFSNNKRDTKTTAKKHPGASKTKEVQVKDRKSNKGSKRETKSSNVVLHGQQNQHTALLQANKKRLSTKNTKKNLGDACLAAPAANNSSMIIDLMEDDNVIVGSDKNAKTPAATNLTMATMTTTKTNHCSGGAEIVASPSSSVEYNASFMASMLIKQKMTNNDVSFTTTGDMANKKEFHKDGKTTGDAYFEKMMAHFEGAKEDNAYRELIESNLSDLYIDTQQH